MKDLHLLQFLMQTTIYILKLEKGKYYVGKSENVMKRYQQHLDGKGSSWTRKYKPVSILKTIPNASPFDEDKYVKEFMATYGIENVRGGAYVSEDLDEVQEYNLTQEIRGAKDLCKRCGRIGHFEKNCYASTDDKGDVIEEESEEEEIVCADCSKEFDNEYAFEKHRCYPKKSYKQRSQSYESGDCYRCGREGHYSSDCYASKHVRGYYLNH